MCVLQPAIRGRGRVGSAPGAYCCLVPLILVLAVIAVVVAMAFVVRQGGAGSGKQFFGTAVMVWVALVALAVVTLAVGTLIFGR